jgi:hypothetical protein
MCLNGVVKRRTPLEAKFNLITSNQYRIFVQEEKKSLVYKDLVRFSKYVQYIPHDTFLLPLTKSELGSILQMEGVRRKAHYLPSAMKMPNEVSVFIASENSGSAKSGRKTVQPRQTDGTKIYVVVVAQFSTEDQKNICQGFHPTTCRVREVLPGKKRNIDTNAENKKSITVRCPPNGSMVEAKAEVKVFSSSLLA